MLTKVVDNIYLDWNEIIGVDSSNEHYVIVMLRGGGTSLSFNIKPEVFWEWYNQEEAEDSTVGFSVKDIVYKVIASRVAISREELSFCFNPTSTTKDEVDEALKALAKEKEIISVEHHDGSIVYVATS